MLVDVGRDGDAIAAPLEQVDGRRAVEPELLRVDDPLEIRRGPVEQQHDVERLRACDAQRFAQLVDREEQESLRKREILVEQPVAVEASRLVREKRLVLGEAHGTHRRGPQELEPLGRALGPADNHAAHAARQELVEPRCDVVGAGEMKRQAGHREAVERDVARRMEAQAYRALDCPIDRQAVDRQVGRRPAEHRLGELERPQRHRVRGLELARRLLALGDLAAQDGSTGQQDTRLHVDLGELGRQADDGRGRRGCQVVRVDDLEQPLREARELRVHLELYPCREERGTFEEALDVGIGDLDALHAEASRDLGKLLPEFRAELPEVAEFAVEVVEEPRVHQPAGPVCSCSTTSPLSRSRLDRRRSSSGYGIAHSLARTSNPSMFWCATWSSVVML